jgi:GH15 family glucan-1,4-alpha-glucosidase
MLDRCGHRQVSRQFFEFCRRILPTDRPILMHKYCPDGSLGASWHPWVVDGKPEVPFQEDETALTIIALEEHSRHHDDFEFIADMFEHFVGPAADFLYQYRDPVSGLPQPSWDLWEERRGVHAFTVAAVASALRAAANLAHAVHDKREARFRTGFEEVVAGLDRMYDDVHGCFFRRVVPTAKGGYDPDAIVDSSVLGIGLLGALPPSDPRIASTLKVVEERLTVHSAVGGIARYDGDYYFRRSGAYPGNPWFICTLWVAQTQILLAETLADLDQPLAWLDWAVRYSAPTGVMSEQIHPDTGEPLSVSPLTWSHAEYVKTAFDYVEKRHQLMAGAADK